MLSGFLESGNDYISLPRHQSPSNSPPPDSSLQALKVIFILGPTATGKSALALRLALSFKGEIINSDSRQVYRYMDIGTAKPSLEDRHLVPHHLVDILNPDSSFDLASFLAKARTSIQDINCRGKLPIVVGGSGQYMWALMEGWQVPHVPPNYSFRSNLEKQARLMGPVAIHDQLANVNPQVANRIDPQNVRRVIRALELHHASMMLGHDTIKKSPPPFRSLIIGLFLDRESLCRRIDERVENMMSLGLVKEVETLLGMGYSQDLPAFSSIGYREMILHLRNQLPLSDAIQNLKLSTHKFARRQQTWNRRNGPKIQWIQAEPDPFPQSQPLVQEFLAGNPVYGTIDPDRFGGI